jgi:uncharacterized protein (DUF2147 family)
VITVFIAAALIAPSADSVVGQWKTETRGGIVAIQRCGASICGTLVTSDAIRTNPALKDANNKDEKLRGRQLKGVLLLQGFTQSDGGWDGGTVYNAEDGRIYKARITPVDADHLHLRGCVFVPLCKTQTWVRVR